MIAALFSILFLLNTEVPNTSPYFDDVKITAKQTPSEISINIQSQNFHHFQEVVLERSTNPNNGFRPIKIIGQEHFTNLLNNELKCKDDHPLGQQTISFYRVRVVIDAEIVKIFPPMRVDSYQDRVLQARKTLAAKPKGDSKETEDGSVETLVRIENDEDDKNFDDSSMIAKSSQDLLNNTNFRIEKDADNARILYVNVKDIDKLSFIYVMVNDKDQGDYFSLKELNKNEIAMEFNDGQLAYKFTLGDISHEKNANFRMKLSMINTENQVVETAIKEFN